MSDEKKFTQRMRKLIQRFCTFVATIITEITFGNQEGTQPLQKKKKKTPNKGKKLKILHNFYTCNDPVNNFTF